MTEPKVMASAQAAAVGGFTLTPLVLYVMWKLGDDPSNPLVAGAAAVIGGLLFYGITWLAGYLKASRLSAASDSYDPVHIQRLVREGLLPE